MPPSQHAEPLPPEAGQEPAGPSAQVRTLVSFLLFAHLFSLGLSWTMWRLSSPMRQALRRFPGFYLQLLGMDVAPDSGIVRLPSGELYPSPRVLPKSRRALWHLTQGDALDVDHFLILRDEQGRQVQWPPPGAGGLRHRRYQMIAWEMARLAGIEDTENVLPAALGRGLLREAGMQRATLECRRLLLRAPEEARSNDPTLNDPYHDSRWVTVYQARIWVEGDQVRLLKLESQAESSGPVNRASGTRSGSPGSDANSQP